MGRNAHGAAVEVAVSLGQGWLVSPVLCAACRSVQPGGHGPAEVSGSRSRLTRVGLAAQHPPHEEKMP